MPQKIERSLKVLERLSQDVSMMTDVEFYVYLDCELREEFGIEQLSRSQKSMAVWNVADKIKHLFKLRKKKYIF